MKTHIALFLKGLAMGAANVIPGVSGGTIALITGIYEELIDSIKSFDLKALKLLQQFKIAEFIAHVNAYFLAAVFAGIFISILSLAKLLEFLLESYELWTMAFFFGLILLSIYSVGKTVSKWDAKSVIALIVGTAVAVSIAFLAPATENASFFYVFLCGIVAICSMILPGLSGSFILIIMGNYALILGAVGNFDINILIPLMIGCVVGLVAFSQLLSWVFKHHKDATIATMTGFILGSLCIIWPWKSADVLIIERPGKEAKEVVMGYEWFIPDFALAETWVGIGLIVFGMLSIWIIEKLAGDNTEHA